MEEGMSAEKIERLYAWIATDAEGQDGVPAVMGSGVALPLVGADKARIESFRPEAEDLAHNAGFRVRLVEFTQMVVLETLTPPGGVTGKRDP
jgi:hypothetical protein